MPLLRRSRRASAGPPPAEPVQRPRREWATLPAPATTLSRHPRGVVEPDRFRKDLGTTWSIPPALQPLGHAVSLEAPAGLLAGRAVPVEAYEGATLRFAPSPAAQPAAGGQRRRSGLLDRVLRRPSPPPDTEVPAIGAAVVPRSDAALVRETDASPLEPAAAESAPPVTAEVTIPAAVPGPSPSPTLGAPAVAAGRPAPATPPDGQTGQRPGYRTVPLEPPVPYAGAEPARAAASPPGRAATLDTVGRTPEPGAAATAAPPAPLPLPRRATPAARQDPLAEPGPPGDDDQVAVPFQAAPDIAAPAPPADPPGAAPAALLAVPPESAVRTLVGARPLGRELLESVARRSRPGPVPALLPAELGRVAAPAGATAPPRPGATAGSDALPSTPHVPHPGPELEERPAGLPDWWPTQNPTWSAADAVLVDASAFTTEAPVGSADEQEAAAPPPAPVPLRRRGRPAAQAPAVRRVGWPVVPGPHDLAGPQDPVGPYQPGQVPATDDTGDTSDADALDAPAYRLERQDDRPQPAAPAPATPDQRPPGRLATEQPVLRRVVRAPGHLPPGPSGARPARQAPDRTLPADLDRPFEPAEPAEAGEPADRPEPADRWVAEPGSEQGASAPDVAPPQQAAGPGRAAVPGLTAEEVSAQLRHELLLDRERAGTLADLW